SRLFPLFFPASAPTELSTLSLHDALPISSADDLFHIGTLGFRGEALASIGGVAQVVLQSRPRDRDCGAEIACNGSELSPVRPWRSEEHTSELQSRSDLVCRLLLEKKNKKK